MAETLTTTITESVTLQGAARGNTITETYSIDNVFERVVTIGTDQITLYSTHASLPEGNVFDDDLVKYARITNLHSSQTVTIEITNDQGDEALFKIKAGESFILNGHDDMCSFKEGAAVDAGLHAITIVKATASGAATPVEVFVASSN